MTQNIEETITASRLEDKRKETNQTLPPAKRKKIISSNISQFLIRPQNDRVNPALTPTNSLTQTEKIVELPPTQQSPQLSGALT